MKDSIRLFGMIPDSSLLLRADGVIHAVNKPAAMIFQRSALELRGARLQEFATSPASVDALLRACSTSEKPHRKTLHWRLPDGGKVRSCCEAVRLLPSREDFPSPVVLQLCVAATAPRSGGLSARFGLLDSLRELEDRFQRLFQQCPVGVVMVGEDRRFRSPNPALCRMLGYRERELCRLTFLDVTHPEDRAIGLAELERLRKGEISSFRVQKRYLTKTGKVVCGDLWVSAVVPGESVGFLRNLVILEDITARKEEETRLRQQHRSMEHALHETKEELRALAARLIRVQEMEQRRLARELHDNVNQRMALMGIRMQRLEEKISPEATEKLAEEIQLLRQNVADVSDELHRIAYQLHPSILEHFGLQVALRTMAAEFRNIESVRVRFSSRNIPSELPLEVAATIYCVAQEALRNSARHAPGAPVTISLVQTGGLLRLTVRDHGPGFDPQEAPHRGGLGLIGMQERARLVGGVLRLKSKPGAGSFVSVRVPLR